MNVLRYLLPGRKRAEEEEDQGSTPCGREQGSLKQREHKSMYFSANVPSKLSYVCESSRRTSPSMYHESTLTSST